MATKAGAVILILALLLGARGVAREIAAPFEGIDRLVLTRTAPTPEPADSTRYGYEFRPVLADESEPVSGAIASLPDELRASSASSRAVGVFYLRDDGVLGYREVDLIGMPPPGGWEIGGVGFTDIDERADSAKHATGKTVWEQWREQAIAALPEHLRNDSEYRTAIDHQYHLLISPAVDTANDWTPDRPQVGVNESYGVFISDNKILKEFFPSDPETEKLWSAHWEDWKARAIAALPESERNDPNRLKEIDTNLERISSQVGVGLSGQKVQWSKFTFEAMNLQEKVQTAAK